MKKTEALFLGIIAAFCSVVFLAASFTVWQVFLSRESSAPLEISLYTPSFIVFAVLVEEFFKTVFIGKKISQGQRNFRAMLCGAVFGIGFSLVEIFFIILEGFSETGILRGILEISTIHISTSIAIVWLFQKNQLKYPFGAPLVLIIVALPHLAYNFSSYLEAERISLTIASLSFLVSAYALWTRFGQRQELA